MPWEGQGLQHHDTRTAQNSTSKVSLARSCKHCEQRQASSFRISRRTLAADFVTQLIRVDGSSSSWATGRWSSSLASLRARHPGLSDWGSGKPCSCMWDRRDRKGGTFTGGPTSWEAVGPSCMLPLRRGAVGWPPSQVVIKCWQRNGSSTPSPAPRPTSSVCLSCPLNAEASTAWRSCGGRWPSNAWPRSTTAGTGTPATNW